MSILMTEYDYATDIAVKQEEAFEEGVSIGLERGIERGAYETKLETARSFLTYGDSPEKVAMCTGLPLETVLMLTQS